MSTSISLLGEMSFPYLDFWFIARYLNIMELDIIYKHTRVSCRGFCWGGGDFFGTVKLTKHTFLGG